jgi:hypothetical protein
MILFCDFQIMKRKFKQWWSTISPRSTKRTITGANHVNMAIIVLSFRSKYVRKSKEINFMYIESKLFKCFECLKSAKYRVVRAIAMAFNATFNNILFISWRLSENHRSATNHQRNIFLSRVKDLLIIILSNSGNTIW